MGLLERRELTPSVDGTRMVLAFSFWASAIIAVYRAFDGDQVASAHATACTFPEGGIGILIFCKYVIQ
jgi:hypothetical protein